MMGNNRSYSFREYEELTRIDRDYTPKERRLFDDYGAKFNKMIEYQDYLIPELKKELNDYNDYLTMLASVENINQHQSEALERGKTFVEKQKDKSEELLLQKKIKKEESISSNNYGLASVIQIIVITMILIGVLVLLLINTF